MRSVVVVTGKGRELNGKVLASTEGEAAEGSK